MTKMLKLLDNESVYPWIKDAAISAMDEKDFSNVLNQMTYLLQALTERAMNGKWKEEFEDSNNGYNG